MISDVRVFSLSTEGGNFILESKWKEEWSHSGTGTNAMQIYSGLNGT